MTTGSSEWTGLVLSNGRYVVSDKLGEGGMGAVYRATDRNLDAEVVIKAPLRSMLEDPDFAHRFEVEIRSLARLSHPHIVKVSDVGSWDGLPFAVMQYLPGGNLEDRRPSGTDGPTGILDPQDVPRWLPGVARALDYVHASGYIHRDVKPGNILFDAQGHPFLSDFGVVKVLATSADARSGRSGMTSVGMVIGTPEYMAPELIMGDACDGRVDQYALGVTVFEMLAGQRPFEDATKTKLLVLHTAKAAPQLTELCTWVPEPVSRAVLRSLAKSPAERYPNCALMADAVCSVIETVYAGKPERVRVKCPACEKSIRVPASDFQKLRGAGRPFPCPSCQALVPVSKPATSVRRGSSGAMRSPEGTLVESPRSVQATQKVTEAAPADASRFASRPGRTLIEPVGLAGGAAGRTVIEPMNPSERAAGRTVVEPAAQAGGVGGRTVMQPVNRAGGAAGRTVAEPVSRPSPTSPNAPARTILEKSSRPNRTVLVGAISETDVSGLAPEFSPEDADAGPKAPLGVLYAIGAGAMGVFVVSGLVAWLLFGRESKSDGLALASKSSSDALSTAFKTSARNRPTENASETGRSVAPAVASASGRPGSGGLANSETTGSTPQGAGPLFKSAAEVDASTTADPGRIENTDRGETSTDKANKGDGDVPERNPPAAEEEGAAREQDSPAHGLASTRLVSLKDVRDDPAAFVDRIVEIDQLYCVQSFDAHRIDLVACDVGWGRSHGSIAVKLTQKRETLDLDLDPRLGRYLYSQNMALRMDRVNNSLKLVGIPANAIVFNDNTGDRLAVLSVRVSKPLDKGAGVGRPRVVKLEFLKRLELKPVFSKHLTKPKLGVDYRVLSVSAEGVTEGLGNHASWERKERLHIITSNLKSQFDRIVAAIRDSRTRAMMEKENNVLMQDAMRSLQQQIDMNNRARQQSRGPR